MADTHPLILSLRSAGLRDVDTCNLDEVHNMWAAFSRAKNCIDGGDRLEYLSWRIYSREIIARKPGTAHSPALAEVPIEPPPEGESPSDAEMAASESDFETCSDSSEDEEVAAVASPKPPAPAPASSETVQFKEKRSSSDTENRRPKLVRERSKEQPKSCLTMPHRRISSTELELLFKDARKLNSNALKECAETAKQQTAPAPRAKPESVAIPQTSSQLETSIASSAYQTRFGIVPGMSARAPAPRFSSESLQSLPPDDQREAVRGFSPSSVSVSVSMNRGLAHEASMNASRAPSRSTPPPPASDGGEQSGKLVTWKKASLPREKIFFIEAESDSDASNASVDNDKRVGLAEREKKTANRTSRKSARNSQDEDEDGDYDDLVDDLVGDLNDGDDVDDDDQSVGSSGWDDTSADENSDDQEDVEAYRAEDMFKERTVPSKPPLKRSLLSTLFVNQLKEFPKESDEQDLGDDQASDSQARAPHLISASPDDRAEVAAPVNILLGAAVAHHMPLPMASPRTVRRNMLQTELSSSLRENMKQSRNHDVDLLFKQRPEGGSRSRSESVIISPGSSAPATPGAYKSVHITARPEMYRASTDNDVTYHRPSDERAERTPWQSQQEDIYDPMNYHSRGW